MDLPELLYKRFLNWRNRKKINLELEKSVALNDIKPRLTLIARALTGAPIEIVPAVREGGRKGLRFFLPEKVNLFEDLKLNFNLYLLRIFLLSKQYELGVNWNGARDKSLVESQAAAQKSGESMLIQIEKEFPNFNALYREIDGQLEDKTWIFGKWMEEDLRINPDSLNAINDLTGESDPEKITTEIEAKAVEEIISVQVDKEKQEEFTLMHHFEKIETIEEFDDIWRDFDGDDSLKDDLDAMNDINMKHTVRVDDVVHSVYKAEFGGQLTVAESKALKESGFYYSYPEWNAKAFDYRENFCKVFPLLYKSSKREYVDKVLRENRRAITSLKKNLAQFFNASKQVKRVSQGDEFDLDEVIDMYADIHAKVTPNERIYTTKRKKKKDLSMLFLIDLSLSGDSYVSGQRVIDIEKQAVIILGEVFSEFDIEFQVDGFFSKTRNFCSYVTMKHFRDDWKRGRVNIGSISPQGFTRIGPAIRHAGYILSKRSSKRKWVILLSDGKPNDYDRYEGRYGVEDIKHALKELKKSNVESYAIAIEEMAKYYLPQMFGHNHYSILSEPKLLPAAVMKLYRKIAISR